MVASSSASCRLCNLSQPFALLTEDTAILSSTDLLCYSKITCKFPVLSPARPGAQSWSIFWLFVRQSTLGGAVLPFSCALCIRPSPPHFAMEAISVPVISAHEMLIFMIKITARSVVRLCSALLLFSLATVAAPLLIYQNH